MTDGEAEFDDSNDAALATFVEEKDVVLFTFALGSGADTTVTKRMACQNNGVFFNVADGGDLGDAMSSYYTYIAAASEQTGTRWVLYNDVSGIELLASCTAIYDKGAQATEELSVVLGVVCMDINVMVPLKTLQLRGDYQDFYSKVVDASNTCSPMFEGVGAESKAALVEKIRKRLQSRGASTCGENAGADWSAGTPGNPNASMMMAALAMAGALRVAFP
jgi:hypothetical protein